LGVAVFHTKAFFFRQSVGASVGSCSLLFAGHGEKPSRNLTWENLFLVLDACIQETRRKRLQEELRKQKNEGIWGQLGIPIFGSVLATRNDAAEAGVHTFLVGCLEGGEVIRLAGTDCHQLSIFLIEGRNAGSNLAYFNGPSHELQVLLYRYS